MYEMYAAIMWISEDTVVTLVARRPDRIINPEVVYAFVGVADVKFAFWPIVTAVWEVAAHLCPQTHLADWAGP